MCDGVTDDSVAGCALAQSIAVFHFLRSSFDVRSTFVRRSFVVPSSSFLRRRSFVVVRSTFVPSFLRRRSFVVPSSFLCRSFVDFVFRFVCCPFIRSFACLVLVVCRRLSPWFVQRRRLSNVVVCPTSSFVQRRRLSSVVVCPTSSFVRRATQEKLLLRSVASCRDCLWTG